MNTLERYIGKSILGTIFATLLMLVGLSAIIKFVEQFRNVGKGTYDILQAIAYTVLTMPKDVETFFPMAALLGALIALGNLAIVASWWSCNHQDFHVYVSALP